MTMIITERMAARMHFHDFRKEITAANCAKGTAVKTYVPVTEGTGTTLADVGPAANSLTVASPGDWTSYATLGSVDITARTDATIGTGLTAVGGNMGGSGGGGGASVLFLLAGIMNGAGWGFRLGANAAQEIGVICTNAAGLCQFLVGLNSGPEVLTKTLTFGGNGEKYGVALHVRPGSATGKVDVSLLTIQVTSAGKLNTQLSPQYYFLKDHLSGWGADSPPSISAQLTTTGTPKVCGFATYLLPINSPPPEDWLYATPRILARWLGFNGFTSDEATNNIEKIWKPWTKFPMAQGKYLPAKWTWITELLANNVQYDQSLILP